jgi:hypothetical protein
MPIALPAMAWERVSARLSASLWADLNTSSALTSCCRCLQKRSLDSHSATGDCCVLPARPAALPNHPHARDLHPRRARTRPRRRQPDGQHALGVTSPLPTAPSPPRIRADSWLAFCLSTGRDRHIHSRRPWNTYPDESAKIWGSSPNVWKTTCWRAALQAVARAAGEVEPVSSQPEPSPRAAQIRRATRSARGMTARSPRLPGCACRFDPVARSAKRCRSVPCFSLTCTYTCRVRCRVSARVGSAVFSAHC